MKPYSRKEYENAQNCYRMAYHLLPHYLQGQPQRVLSELAAGRVGAMFFYVMACQMEQREPDEAMVNAFQVHNGTLREGCDYAIIQYPTPPPVDIAGAMDAASPKQITEIMKNIVLAPYFSAILIDQNSNKLEYFILGQSLTGNTTFRTVTPEGNFNLGAGCEPDLEPFLNLLRQPKPEAIAGVVSSNDGKGRKKRWWEFWR